jgi:hypothetical protein
MVVKRIFHFVGAGLERLKQIPVATQKIFKNVCQLVFCLLRTERKDPIDNMIGARLICRIEIAWLRCGFERPYDDSGRIGPEIEILAIQDRG